MSTIVKVVICDDEDDARLILRQYIGDFPQLKIIQECSNGPGAVKVIDELEPDLIFLDIQMPGLSGFQVLQRIVHVPKIIFSTAFDRYALKAFDSNAVDYLLKPYTKERFSQAVDKILQDGNKNMESIRNLSDHLQSSLHTHPEKVLVEANNRLIALAVTEINWIEADGDYTRLHAKQKFYISSYGITELEQKLNPVLFMRIHRSCIININKVKEVFRESGGYQVLMEDGSKHKVGRSYSHVIKKISL